MDTPVKRRPKRIENDNNIYGNELWHHVPIARKIGFERRRLLKRMRLRNAKLF